MPNTPRHPCPVTFTSGVRKRLLLGTALIALAALLPEGAGGQQYWDGANTTPGNVPDGRGGSGTWNATDTNWTNQAGSANSAWQAGGTGIFPNPGGVGTSIVTVTGTPSFSSLSFFNSYRLNGNIAIAGPAVINVSGGVTRFTSVVSGAGGLTITGDGGVTFEGANTYTGGTTISGGGILRIASDSGLGDASGGVTLDSGKLYLQTLTSARPITLQGTGNQLLVITGLAAQLEGVISGSGEVTVNTGGTGSLTLTGANTLSGRVSLTGNGQVIIGNGGTSGTLGTGEVNLSVGSPQLVFNRSDTFTVVNAITGRGASVTQAGAGTTIFTGANTYTAPTIISAGTLQIGDGGTTGTLGSGAVTNNAQLAFNRSDTLVVTAAIAGTGNVTQAGTGTTVLTGANTFSGTTTISAGTLQIGNGGTVGSLGTGNVTNNGLLAFNRSDAVTVGNLISGTGGVVQMGPGTLTLTANNTYTGGTTVSGGTLSVGDGGTTGAIQGDVRLQNGATLAFNRLTDSGFGGVISGTGNLVKQGASLLTLSGANSFTGGVSVERGSLALVGNGTLGAGTVALTLAANTIFDVSDMNPGRTVTLAALNGAGTVSLGRFNLILGAAGQTGTFSGRILDGGMEGGTGARLTVAAGTTILSGNNTYTGGTTINAGATLQLGDGGTTGSVQGAIVNNGTLVLNRFASMTLANVVSGSGQLVVERATRATLTGANSFTGGIVVNSGTVAFASQANASTGMITLNGGGLLPSPTAPGTLTLNNPISIGPERAVLSGVDQDGVRVNLTLTGATSGAGILMVVGPGLVTLTGDSTRTGMTIIGEDGTLQVGNGGTTGSLGSGDIRNLGTLNLNRSDAVTYAGQMDGTGALGILSGRVTATGDLIHTGGTSIASGATLQIGNGGATGSLAGNVVNNGTLIFNRAGSVTYAGVISGAGGLTQNGPGNLILTGVHSYTGPTLVNAGTLSVNGSIASSSSVTVAPGATLGGTGTVGTVTVPSGGTMAPGNSIGTINVGSLVLAAGSTTAMEVQGSLADRINVAGNATLGGTLRLLPLGGTYNFNTPYILIQAGSVTGNFATVTTAGNFGAGVNPTVSVTATQVLLGLTPAILVPEAGGGGGNDTTPNFTTFNQRSTAGALDAANRAGGNLNPFFNVYNQPASTIGLAVNQLSGEVATSTGAMGFASGDQFLATLLDPLGVGRESMMGGRLRPGGDGDGQEAAGRKRYAVWGTATGAYNRTTGDSSDGSASRTARTAGFALGFDHLIGSTSMAGVAIAVGESSASLASGQGSATANFGQIGAYGTTRVGSFTLSGAGAFTFMDVDTKRTLYFLNSDQQRAGFGAQVYSLRAEARQDGVAFGGGFRVQPIAALQWQQVNNQGYTESSYVTGRTLGVSVGGQSQTSLRSELGAQVDGVVQLGSVPVQGYVRAAWAYYMTRDASMAVGFASLPNAGFTVRGARPDANAALLSGGIEMPIAAGLTLGARVDSEFSSNVTQVAGTARLRYRF